MHGFFLKKIDVVTSQKGNREDTRHITFTKLVSLSSSFVSKMESNNPILPSVGKFSIL